VNAALCHSGKQAARLLKRLTAKRKAWVFFAGSTTSLRKSQNKRKISAIFLTE